MRRDVVTRRWRAVVAWACAAASILLAAEPARGEIIDRVLAVVGSQVVTLSDVRAAQAFGLIPPSAATGDPQDVLAQLVNRQLMLSDVDRYSAAEPERTLVDRRLAAIRGAFRGATDFAEALARTAMSEERLRNIVTDNFRIEAYVEQRFGAPAQPTPEEVQRYYREHPDEFTQDGRLAAFDDVQQAALQKVSAERKRALITDWLDRLRRRGQVDRPPATGIR
jgi:hypothetical protein